MTTLLAICAAAILSACASSSPNGYTKAYTPVNDLEKIKADFDQNNIPSGIGIGQSKDEMIARTQSIDEAQTAIQVSVKNLISRLKEQYTVNANNESARAWEDLSVSFALGDVSGVTIYKTITQFSEQDSTYKVFSLAAMSPSVVDAATQKAIKQADENFVLTIETDKMKMELEKAEGAYKRFKLHAK